MFALDDDRVGLSWWGADEVSALIMTLAGEHEPGPSGVLKESECQPLELVPSAAGEGLSI